MKQKRKKTEVKFRHWLIVVFAKIILWPIVKIKYRYQYHLHRELKGKGPFLVLANHTVALDPVLLGLSFPYTNYYIATEQIFNLGFLSKLLVYAVNPISKAKSTNDITTIRKSKRIVDEGGSIVVYPEGNVTYDGNVVNIDESIVKLVRLLKIPIIIFVSEGLYFSNPRWSVYRKKGKSKGEIIKIIEKDEYDKLTNEELFALIKSLISINAYNQQENNLQAYKGRKLAEGLERLIFMDLNTKTPFVTYSKDNKLKSTVSNFELTYDKYGYVTNELGQKKTLIEMNKQVLEQYYEYYLNTKDNLLYEEEVLLAESNIKFKKNLGKTILKMYKDKLELKSKKVDLLLNYKEITSFSIQGKKKLIINTYKDRYLITLDIYSSPYKYLLTHQIYLKENDEDGKYIRQLGL